MCATLAVALTTFLFQNFQNLAVVLAHLLKELVVVLVHFLKELVVVLAHLLKEFVVVLAHLLNLFENFAVVGRPFRVENLFLIITTWIRHIGTLDLILMNLVRVADIGIIGLLSFVSSTVCHDHV